MHSHTFPGQLHPAWPGPLAGLLAFGLYALTLAPGLTWAHSGADGGDFLAAALSNGVPHPSGSPTYLLMLRAAVALLRIEPARAGNWLSAACAAAAVALVADLAQRMIARVGADAGRPAATGWQAAAALSAALAWAASPSLWGQAVITEVYALNTLAVALVCWLLWRWREARDAGQRSETWLAAAGLTLGLGLGAHLSLALLLPAAVVWVRDGARATASGALRRGLLTAAAAAALGLAVYAYLPLAAATRPPVNWEDPATPAGLWALVTGRLYRDLLFGVRPAFLPGRVAAWAGEAVRQLGGPWSALLALAGLWRLDRRLHGGWGATLLAFLLFSAYAIGYDTADSFVYLIPAWAVLACWLALGLDWLREVGEDALGRRLGADGRAGQSFGARKRISSVVGSVGPTGVLREDRPQPARGLRLILAALLFVVPAISVARFWRVSDLSRDRAAQDFVAAALADAAPGAVILTSGDGPTFALWYTVYGLGHRPDIAPVNVNLYAFDWYRRTLAHQHPDLAAAMGDPDAAPRLDRFLAQVAAARPLYRADALDGQFPGLIEQPAGSLVRLIGE